MYYRKAIYWKILIRHILIAALNQNDLYRFDWKKGAKVYKKSIHTAYLKLWYTCQSTKFYGFKQILFGGGKSLWNDLKKIWNVMFHRSETLAWGETTSIITYRYL